ncbi:MAG: YihY family inner membrane protein [Proteobacteria bacterium]|nr:YihY family inner membrane protein [Pseudomonadota bacterium]
MDVSRSMKATLRERVAEGLQALQTWPWLDTCTTLYQRFREDRLGLTASSLTFTTLISLVPLLTVMLAVFTAFPMFATFQIALQKYFLQMLIPAAIADPVLKALTQFATKANRLGSVGLVVLVFSAIALMLTIDKTLNGIWRVRTPRPIAQRVLVYWAAMTLGPLMLGVSLTLTSYAISAGRGVVNVLPGGVGLLLSLLEFALLAAGFAGLFHYVPNTHVRWRHAIGGAVFAALGFEIAKKLLAWYLTEVPTYSMVYGAFATVPIFLVWLYVGWVVVLLGAVIAAYAPSLRMRVKRWPDTPGARLQLTIAVLRELEHSRRARTPGLNVDQLAVALHTDPLQIEPVLDVLTGLDWVGRLDEEGNPRHVLLCDPAATPAAGLLALTLVEPTPALQGLWHRAGFDRLTLRELMSA